MSLGPCLNAPDSFGKHSNELHFHLLGGLLGGTGRGGRGVPGANLGDPWGSRGPMKASGGSPGVSVGPGKSPGWGGAGVPGEPRQLPGEPPGGTFERQGVPWGSPSSPGMQQNDLDAPIKNFWRYTFAEIWLLLFGRGAGGLQRVGLDSPPPLSASSEFHACMHACMNT